MTRDKSVEPLVVAGICGKGRKSLYSAHGCDINDDDLEFVKAVDAWKTKTGHRFPALTDLLKILRGLGWRKC